MEEVEKALNKEREFVAQVIRNLPNTKIKQFWIENPRLLRRTLTNALMSGIEERFKEIELKDVSDVKIGEGFLSVRCQGALKRLGITTIGELTKTSEEDLLKLRNFGNPNLKEIKKFLFILGLNLQK